MGDVTHVTPPPRFNTTLQFVFICHLFVFGLFMGVVHPINSWAKERENKMFFAALTELSLEQLMDIEVATVSRDKSTVGKSAAAIFVITPEMIRRSGATMIPELFRMVPGVNIARLDNNKWNISMRGFNGDRFQGKLLVQMDGRTLYTPISSGVFWDMVDYPLEDIKKIEVIRGSAASAWGSNAVNGIINIITKSASETYGGVFTVGGGTQEQGFGTARYGGKLGNRLDYRVYTKGFNRSEQFSASDDSSDAWWGTNSGVRFDWQPNEKDAVTFEGSYLHSNAGRKDFRAMVDAPFSYANIEDEVGDNGDISAYWTRELRHGSNLKLQFYWDHFNRRSTGLRAAIRLDTVDLDFQHQIFVGERLDFVYGTNYRFVSALLQASQNDNGFGSNFDHDHRNTHLFSGFLQSQTALVKKRLELTLGSKFEHNTFGGFEIQPTGRLLWTPMEWQSAWVAVSRAIRAPNFLENELALTLPEFSPAANMTIFPRIVSNSNFKPENVVEFAGGYRVQVQEKFSADLALFYNVYSDLKAFMPGTVITDTVTGVSILPLQPQNLLKARTYGVELALNGQPTDWWRLLGAYTFLKTNFNPDASLPAASQTSLRAAEGQSPTHQFYLQSSLTLPHRVEFDLIGRFVSSLHGFNPSSTPGFSDTINNYVSLDAILGWKPVKNLELEVVGQNLLANHHAETGANPTVRNPAVEILRSVYGKVTWNF